MHQQPLWHARVREHLARLRVGRRIIKVEQPWLRRFVRRRTRGSGSASNGRTRLLEPRAELDESARLMADFFVDRRPPQLRRVGIDAASECVPMMLLDSMREVSGWVRLDALAQ